MALLKEIKIVLVEPSHPGNIGSTARAMKTMGITQLCLVNPKQFPDSKAIELSSGAADILEHATVFKTLDEALANTHLIFMTSARLRSIGPPVISPEQAGHFAYTAASSAQLAFVFGRERTGLYKEEILKGHYHIEIPTHPDYRSLNLAQAVQIVAYELAKQLRSDEVSMQGAEVTDVELATHEQLEALYHHLTQTLTRIDFVKSSNPKLVLYRLRRLLNRTGLELKEVNILRGILTEMDKRLYHSKD